MEGTSGVHARLTGNNTRAADVALAVVLGLGLFLVYNANGREIGSYDSQPTKFAARELLVRGTLSLNHVIGQTPQLAERSGFQLARDGRYRSAYSPVPAIAAAVITWPLAKVGLIDVRAPLAPNLISALSASVLVSAAVALTFLIARLRIGRWRALALSCAFGLGTGYWPTASQTVWQHETTIFGLSLAIFAATLLDDDRVRAPIGKRLVMLLITVGIGIGLATGSRLQLAPAMLVLLIGFSLRFGIRNSLLIAAVAASIIAPVCLANIRWFGQPLGAAPMLEALHETVHGTTGSFSLTSGGLIGLLVSPNRGLFIYSPVVLVALLGVPAMVRSPRHSLVRIFSIAALVQFGLYGCYVVWWGGHTYGPRYMLDVLPLMIPLTVAGAATVRGATGISLAALALAWSVSVSAIGAFNYPEGRWNNTPADVDRNHERLWDWRDNQILRSWNAGTSPQNFSLFDRAAFRVPEDER